MRVQPNGPIELRIASSDAKAFLELERERLKLATAEAERKATGGLDPALASILIAAMTLLGAVAGYVITRRTEIWKTHRTKDLELAFARSTHLLDQRVEKYQTLWRTFGYLSRYPLQRGFTVGKIGTLREILHHWYFDEAGGMFLSEDDGERPGSRSRYFALQAGLGALEVELKDVQKAQPLMTARGSSQRRGRAERRSAIRRFSQGARSPRGAGRQAPGQGALRRLSLHARPWVAPPHGPRRGSRQPTTPTRRHLVHRRDP